MKSIKRGRGPSMMGGIASVGMALFGLLWTIVAGSMAGPLFGMFGVIFIGIAISQAIYNFKNATGENRYSEYDITDEYEETDPLNERFGRQRDFGNNGWQGDAGYGASGSAYGYQGDSNAMSGETAFCPYCGNSVDKEYEFCPKCGKKLP